MKERFEGIDGLKTYAILGIVMMHVLANGNFELSGFVFQNLIPSFTNLVFLFMMLSGFGMCCGYYQKISDQEISVSEFYRRRYKKIWPFFALLCACDFIISPSKSALYECFANLTLCQGLLPNMNISVIGVSWTLAVIFVFYLLFPFFCFLLENKRRAWFVFCCALVFNYLCSVYFFDESHIANQTIVNFSARKNILYCAVYFVGGGIVFLYRKYLTEFATRYKYIVMFILLLSAICYFVLGCSALTILFFSVTVLIYSLGCNHTGVINNPVAKFLGGISFEIYLCHMVIYRLLEKLNLINLLGRNAISYMFLTVAVVCGSVVFSICTKWFLKRIELFFIKRTNVMGINHG